jgi:hypothetical protein
MLHDPTADLGDVFAFAGRYALVTHQLNQMSALELHPKRMSQT